MQTNSLRGAKLAQGNLLLYSKGTNSPRQAIARSSELITYAGRNLISPGKLVASLDEWMSEILENDHFAIPFNLVFGSTNNHENLQNHR